MSEHALPFLTFRKHFVKAERTNNIFIKRKTYTTCEYLSYVLIKEFKILIVL